MGWEWVQPTITLLSLIGAILAWLAKLRWSQEYAAAKDEIIKAKEAQIETVKAHKDAQVDALRTQIDALKELSSMKLREHYLSHKDAFEECIDGLEGKIATAESTISEKIKQIHEMEAEGNLHKKELDIARDEIKEMQAHKYNLELEIERMKAEYRNLKDLSRQVISTFNKYPYTGPIELPPQGHVTVRTSEKSENKNGA